MATISSTDTPSSEIQLDITGMTCASCAARIEKKLNRIDGVAGLLNPMIAGLAMALSSVFVVSNSLRLRRFATAFP